MNAIIKKFNALFTHEKDIYVNAARVKDEYKKIRGNSRSTQVTMICSLQLDYIITSRRGPDAGNILNIKIDSNEFKSTTMNVFVKMSQLSRSKELFKKIKNMPDINDNQVDIETVPEEDATQDVETKDAKTVPNQDIESVDLPIIELQEHEMFRDINDEVFDIEVRGERTKDKIYFKAKDIERFFGIDRLIERLIRTDNSAYTLGKDYVFRAEYISPLQGGNCILQQKRNIIHDSVFLTLQGLLRAIFVSKSGNENMMKTMDWISCLVYTHQFGSDEERESLAKDLFKHVLNEGISGLYYVDIGELNDLYDTMQISREQYPPEEYGKSHIAKVGLAQDIRDRVKDHHNKKSGYARWSKKLDHKWSVMLSPSQLSSAEKRLKLHLKAEDFTFDYVDPSGAKHIELIMVHPNRVSKVKTIYKELLKLYPSKENELAEALSNCEDRHQLAISQLKLKCQSKIDKERDTRKDAEHKAELMAERDARKDAEHKSEVSELQSQIRILQLEKTIAEMTVSNK